MNSSLTNDDIVLKKAKPPFSSVFQSSISNRKRYCPLCSKAGIESIVNDENICDFCGDVGIKHGISKDDDLFVVNSVGGVGWGGGDDQGDTKNSNFFSGSFGGLELEKKRPPHSGQRSLQDALKETEISKP